MTETSLNPVGTGGAGSIADWLELAMFVSGRRLLTPGKASDLMGALGGYRDEADIGFAFATLHDRARKTLALYPFRFSKIGLELRTDVDTSPYRLMVLLAAASCGSATLDSGEIEASVEFERVVTVAASGLFGHGSAVRFGYPPEPGRPSDFEDALRWVARRLGSRALPVRGTVRNRSDGGVDALAWRTYGDGRRAAPVAVIQATFDSDVRGKSLEVVANEFDRWVDVGNATLPVLATPLTLDDDPDLFDELSGRVLVLNRWRLLYLLEQVGWAPAVTTTSWADTAIGSASL